MLPAHRGALRGNILHYLALLLFTGNISLTNNLSVTSPLANSFLSSCLILDIEERSTVGLMSFNNKAIIQKHIVSKIEMIQIKLALFSSIAQHAVCDYKMCVI